MNTLAEMGYVVEETKQTVKLAQYVELGAQAPFCTIDPAHASRTPGGTLRNC